MSNMIESSELLYTKSVWDDDYRWIFYNKKLTDDDMSLIDCDYSNIFAQDEETRRKVINENTMVVRRFENAWTFFKFFLTDNKDSFGRVIYALYGCSFHDFNAIKVSDVISSISAYLFGSLYKEKWDKKYKSKIMECNMIFDLYNVYNIMLQNKFRVIQECVNSFLLQNKAEKGFIIHQTTKEIHIESLR